MSRLTDCNKTTDKSKSCHMEVQQGLRGIAFHSPDKSC